jgi:Xaa-Pro aminopeptidase
MKPLSIVMQVAPQYSLAERDRRWAIARTLMDQEQVDALLIFGDREGAAPAPFAPDTYFTNDRPGALVIFPRHGEPVALYNIPEYAIDHLEAVRRGEGTWLSAANVRIGRFIPQIAATLSELGLDAARIGLLGGDPYPPFYFTGAIPYGLFHDLQTTLPKIRFTSVWRRFAMLTICQSDEELAVIAWSARAGERMAQAVLEVTRPGVLESDLYAAASQAALQSGAFSPLILMLTGPDAVGWGQPAWAYRPQTPRRIESGDVVLAELFSTFGMKETQHQLAIAVGKIHHEHERAADIVRASYEACLEQLKPGNTFGDVVKAMEKPLLDAGAWNIRPLIHGLNPFGAIGGFVGGLESIPGAEAYHGHLGMIPLVLAEMELRPGMTFAVEPNCGFSTHEMTVGTTVVVGEDGPIELGTVTTHLLHV